MQLSRTAAQVCLGAIWISVKGAKADVIALIDYFRVLVKFSITNSSPSAAQILLRMLMSEFDVVDGARSRHRSAIG